MIDELGKKVGECRNGLIQGTIPDEEAEKTAKNHSQVNWFSNCGPAVVLTLSANLNKP
jgi:hypothetical protein